MDDRPKIVKELKRRKEADEAALEGLREELGRRLLERAAAQAATEAAEYQGLLAEKAASAAAIQAAQGDIAQAARLEEEARGKEAERARGLRALEESYTSLGRLILEEGGSGEAPVFAAPFKEQLALISPQTQALQDKLQGLSPLPQGEGFFSRIGKGAKSLVARASLEKSLESARRVYRAAGEAFFNQSEGEPLASEAAAALAAGAAEKRREVSALGEEVLRLREEKRGITARYAPEGGPGRKIKKAEGEVSHTEERLGALCRAFGASAASGGLGASFIADGDASLMERLKAAAEAIGETASQIGKIETSLAIDGEKAEIERLKQSIARARQQIEKCQWSITGLEGRIAEREKRVQELEGSL